jgi:membrane protein DedA with SNARE-associated domain
MPLESLIAQYGYLAVFFWAPFEGDWALVLGALAARLGYLQLPWVILVGAASVFLSDTVWFLIGRHQGRAFLARHPDWRTHVDRFRRIVETYQTPFILGIRFYFGMRWAAPFAVGTTRVLLVKFLVLDAVSSLIWGSGVGVAGYFFGSFLLIFLKRVGKYEIWVLAGIALTVILVSLGLYYRHRPKRRKRRSNRE